MIKRLLTLAAVMCATLLNAQIGTEFWFAPPDVTFSHNPPGGVPIYLNISTFSQPATVTIDQPANGGFTPIVVNIPANSSHQEDLSAFVADLETAPTDAVLNTGLRIVSTDTITAYYEVSNTNNTDIFSLKSDNALGQEFYIPLHNHDAFWNHDTYSPPNLAYASFDIVATEDNTTVMIYSPVDVDGHPALTPFTVILNEGETYSCGTTDQTLEFFPYRGSNEPAYTIPGNHPSGAVVISNRDIAITIKDDSNHNPSGGCYDLLGDQIVPVSIVGTEYIAVKGQLNNNGDESVFILATQNNTQVFIDGNPAPIATLFAGQTFRYDMDYLATSADNSVYIETSKPAYVTHVTGFGCEEGQAILPPLGCAGSEQISFTRSTAENFYLNLLVPAGGENNFTVNGPGTAVINPADFIPVPGTGGAWMAAQIQFNTTEIPVNQAHLISNSTEVFSLAIINGGAASGCRYGFFSKFSAEIITDAGPDFTVCANDTAQLSGSVAGGSTTGIWTSSGSGQFLPNNTTLNAQYVPSPADISAGTVTLELESTGNCFPVSDQMVLSITPAPTVDAGADISVCANNPDVLLSGTVTIAAGGIWSGGTGTYSPNNTSLNTTYTPSAAEITAGSVTLTLTTTGNGTCNPETDDIIITFTNAPTVDAGANLSACENNADVTLAGSVTVATGGAWSGGLGTFSPNINALNATYTPTAAELSSGSVVLTLTTTGNGNCNAENDNVTVTYTPAPLANAGVDQTLCANNADATLNGSVIGAAGGQWTGGLGTFIPNSTTLNAVYSPTAAEIASGSLTLTLNTTGNGTCNPETDDVILTFTAAPTADAGPNQTVCANNASVSLNGAVTIATGGQWSGGTGSFTPNPNTLNATYTPGAADISAGSVKLYLTTTGNGSCNQVVDSMTITIDPAPVVNAGTNISVCENNADVSLNGSVSFAGGAVWSGGAGTFNPSNTALNAVYTPTAAEIASGSLVLTLTSTGNGLCNAENDNVTITFTPAPNVNAGPDVTVCANNADVNLAGSVSGATGGQWSGGLGVFNPNNTDLNATYTPTVPEIAGGSLTLTLSSTGNGSCLAETDDMVITFTPSPTVDAGPDVSVCANSPDVNLSGSVTIATGGVWLGGGGSFNPANNDLNATYTPSAAEIAAGTVTLTLQTTGNGSCSPETDDITITIDPEPTANAGPNLISCENNPDVNLSGTVTNASGGIWSGGAGTYYASNTDLNATYTPSPAEISAGTVTLTLTTTGSGLCSAVNDQTTITITPSPTANAGADQTVCANNSNVNLNGSVNGASGGQWLGGLGVFTPSNTALNAVYTPTAGEILSGSLTLTLETTGNGTCLPTSDDVEITFTPGPTADAGPDLTSCENNPDVSLNGTVTVASGGIWSGGGGTFNPSNTDLNATYTPTTTEIANGGLTLYLTTTGNGNCNAEIDSLEVTIDPVPTVNAGADQTICVSNLNVSLSGTVSGITNTGEWSTSGSGFFSPNNQALNATYVASSADSLAGTVTITLTSTNNGTCLPVNDDMVVTILPAGTADAGPDVTVCANNNNVNLNGIIGGAATSGVWSTNGTGVFVPSDTVLNTTYVPSPGDNASGSVTLTLTANSCNAASNSMTVTITPEPVVDAGPDQTVCASNLSISLSGSVSGASTTGVWSTSGTGTFVPNANDLNATYEASSADSLAQTVTIVLEATGIGNCDPVSDTMIINIFPTGTVNAGLDQTLCANNADVFLNGTIGGGASSGQWTSSGSGVFVPNDTTLNATYIPSSADTIAGTISLALTATNSCNLATDFITVTFTPAPIANAGPDQAICGTNPLVNMSGSFSGSTAAEWSTSGTGTFSPNITDMNATYTASSADIANGGVTIYLTTIGNGSCNATVDSAIISISTGIMVDAGPDQNVCSTAGFTTMQGVVSNGSTTGVWSTLGSGTFSPNDSLLTADYNFSAGDLSAGTVSLVLTSTFNGSCLAETDTMIVTFGASAYSNAGADQTVCASNMSINLSGLVTGGATQGEWISLGSGSFSPNNTDMNATYTPSATDSINGSVEIVLNTTDHGSCLQGSDTLLLTIESVPIVNAGTNIQICASVDSIAMSGNVQNAPGGIWSTGGTGSFSPADTVLNAHYIPSAADIAAGSVTIYLNSAGSAICSSETDSITIDLVTPLVPDFDFVETCALQPMSFFDSTSIITGSITDWHWDFDDGDSSIAQNPVHIYTAPGIYDVTLTVTSSLGCEYTIIQTVTVFGFPIADFVYTPQDPQVNNPVMFSDQSSGAVSWSWNFGDNFGTSSDQNPDYTYLDEGSYEVVLTITSPDGCTDTSTQIISVGNEEVFAPVVPSGFSPNNDGDNDVLYVRGGPFESVELRVYNNWGNLIFESTDASIGWDGTWNEKEQPTGDYIYTVKAVTVDGTEHKQHGSVSIIR